MEVKTLISEYLTEVSSLQEQIQDFLDNEAEDDELENIVKYIQDHKNEIEKAEELSSKMHLWSKINFRKM